MYKLITNLPDLGPRVVQKLDDGTCIPFDPDNTDYQQYLRWLEAGNTPIPADEENKE